MSGDAASAPVPSADCAGDAQAPGDVAAALERAVAEDDRLRRDAGEDYETVAALRRMAAEARRAGRDARAGALERAAVGDPETGDADELRRMLAAGERMPGGGIHAAPLRSRSALRWALRRMEQAGGGVMADPICACCGRTISGRMHAAGASAARSGIALSVVCGSCYRLECECWRGRILP